ncbi:MAG TPA: hypothetical protein VF771_21860 [Longimicrobiaceae bacterium]
MKYLVPLCTAAAALVLAAGGAAAQQHPEPTPTVAEASPSDPLAAATRVRSRSDVITTREIDAAHENNAYELVRRLRPQWLHNRGGPYPDPDGSVEIQVYLNGQPVGTVEVLKTYSAMQVGTLRWIDPIRARGTYGPGNGRGVITVTSRL